MFLKLNFGPRIGQIQEMKYADGLALVKLGRAVEMKLGADPQPAMITKPGKTKRTKRFFPGT